MSEQACVVFQTYTRLADVIASDRLTHPRARQRAEELLRMIQDVTSGKATGAHLQEMLASVAAFVAEEPEQFSREIVKIVREPLESARDVFASHIETRNCPTGDCDLLTPAPCQMACPAGIDVASYISLIGANRDAEAIDVIREDNPFPWVCGLVCTHPCELACIRGRIDSPIAIKDLKGFAAKRAVCDAGRKNPVKAGETGYKVCVVGSGPAGLTAAYYLALKGHHVTVLEALPHAGGMMRKGIPRYRLPAEVIEREVAFIKELGVAFRFTTRLGRDTTVEVLRAEGFQAFFLALGAHLSSPLGIKGERDFNPVIDALSFLHITTMGERHFSARRVAVIGGGNVAIDAARTLVRVGCAQVHLLYRRTRAEMPADAEEVKQAEEEGVKLSLLTIPLEVLGAGGKVEALKCLRTRLGDPDERGRRTPVPVAGSEQVIELDAVISAVGQRVDREGLESIENLQWTRQGTLIADPISGATSAEGIFSGGDLVLGPASVVEAIGTGKRAAEGIDRYLRGLPQQRMVPVPTRRLRADLTEVPSSTMITLCRPEMPLLDWEERRDTFQQVELGYDEATARQEARRCLRCDICKRCGRCVTICRESMGIDALQLGYLDAGAKGPTDFVTAAERCILCGACAANCPTGAMNLTDRHGERFLSLCGNVLCREKLEYCDRCGAAVGPARYLEYVKKRTATIQEAFAGTLLCEECARQRAAQHTSILSLT